MNNNLIKFPRKHKGPTSPNSQPPGDITIPAGAWAVAGGAVYWMQKTKPNFLVRFLVPAMTGMYWCDIDEKAYRESFKALRDRGMII